MIKQIVQLFLIIFVFISPLVLAQYDPMDDDYAFANTSSKSVSSAVLDSISSKVFKDDQVKIRIDLTQNHSIYDLVGNFVYLGFPFFMMSHTDYGNHVVNTYGARWRVESKDYPWEALFFKPANIGVKIKVGKNSHSIYAGERVPLFFTPYTLKRLNLFGLQYDFGADRIFNKKSRKSSSAIMLKTFVSTRFNLDSQEPLNDELVIGSDNRLFGAGHLQINIGKIFNLAMLKKQNIGATIVHQQLRNGLYSDTGDMLVYLANYSVGDSILEKSTLYGINGFGKLYGFVYAGEYVYNTSREQIVTSSTSTQPNNLVASAFDLTLHSKNILNSKKIRMSVIGAIWSISSNYKAGWAVDDDDDNDGYLDEDLTHSDLYFPYEAGDTHINEPQSAVIYSKYNKNQNTIPDYKEDFLLFYSDRGFNSSLIFEDANYNGVADYEENDLKPDFPYDKDRFGYRGYFSVNPFHLGAIGVGMLYNQQQSFVSNSQPKTTSLFFGYQKKAKLFDMIGMNLQGQYDIVKDTIADDYVSLNTYEKIQDTLAYQDNSIVKVEGIVHIINVKGLIASVKIRRDWNQRNFDNVMNTVSRDIFKIGYNIKMKFLERLTITPQVKFEKSKNIFVLPNGEEILITSDDVIKDEIENYYQNALILKAKYDLDDGFYVIAGLQTLKFNNAYSILESYNKSTAGIQIVLKDLMSKTKVGRRIPMAFMAGYKITQQDFYMLNTKKIEQNMFATFFISF